MSAAEEAARWGEIAREAGTQRSLWDRDWFEEAELHLRDLAEGGAEFVGVRSSDRVRRYEGIQRVWRGAHS